MAGEDSVARTLADHERRLRRLEASLEGGSKPKRLTPTKTLEHHIILLRDSRFFSSPRTAQEVHKKVQPTYHCDPNRVAVALYRLALKKKLRKSEKRIGRRSYKAFVW